MISKDSFIYDYVDLEKNVGWYVLGFQSWLLEGVEAGQEKRESSKIIKEKWYQNEKHEMIPKWKMWNSKLIKRALIKEGSFI